MVGALQGMGKADPHPSPPPLWGRQRPCVARGRCTPDLNATLLVPPARIVGTLNVATGTLNVDANGTELLMYS